MYNASEPLGGNPLTVDVNAQYAGLEFHYVYLAIMAFLVWLIIVSLLESGTGVMY